MNLLVVVVNDRDHVQDVVEAMLEINARSLTAIRTESLVHLCVREAPIFAGLRQLVTEPETDNRTIFGVVEDPSALQELEKTLNGVDLSLRDPGMGVAFCLPLNGAVLPVEED